MMYRYVRGPSWDDGIALNTKTYYGDLCTVMYKFRPMLRSHPPLAPRCLQIQPERKKYFWCSLGTCFLHLVYLKTDP